MSVHHQLVTLCRELGHPSRDLAILGEGNASARLDDETLVVTRSGSQLAEVTADDLVAVPLAPAASLARSCSVDPTVTVERADLSALVEPGPTGERAVPSIETLLHALVLERTGVAFVGHTHPTAILGLACSNRAEEAFAGPVFPDEVVVCGPRYLLVPYASPGAALAAALDAALTTHHDAEGVWPRAIVLVNHGLLALGATPAEVMAITAMADKAARVRRDALAVGGLRLLPDAEVDALTGRDDERYRRRLLVDGQK